MCTNANHIDVVTPVLAIEIPDFHTYVILLPLHCVTLQSTRTNNCVQTLTPTSLPGAVLNYKAWGCGRGGGGGGEGRGGMETHVKIKEGAVPPVHNRLCVVGPLHQYLVHLSRGHERKRTE